MYFFFVNISPSYFSVRNKKFSLRPYRTLIKILKIPSKYKGDINIDLNCSNIVNLERRNLELIIYLKLFNENGTCKNYFSPLLLVSFIYLNINITVFYCLGKIISLKNGGFEKINSKSSLLIKFERAIPLNYQSRSSKRVKRHAPRKIKKCIQRELHMDFSSN